MQKVSIFKFSNTFIPFVAYLFQLDNSIKHINGRFMKAINFQKLYNGVSLEIIREAVKLGLWESWGSSVWRPGSTTHPRVSFCTLYTFLVWNLVLELFLVLKVSWHVLVSFPSVSSLPPLACEKGALCSVPVSEQLSNYIPAVLFINTRVFLSLQLRSQLEQVRL